MHMADAASIAALAAVAIADAVKAAGTMVEVEPEEFVKVLLRAHEPLVVMAEGGFFKAKYQYVMSYKGLAFFTQSKQALQLPAGAEVVKAEKIWMPTGL
jgi:hypothetical protein